ncbi:AsnC family transcriptional regulator [Candidatus Woesearchaeota archaeon]|nr:AsnC family transcriptional regulator [Candidatus Woesearchaeota archaeon]
MPRRQEPALEAEDEFPSDSAKKDVAESSLQTAAMKIDSKDKEILCLLNEHARITSKALGQQVGISREVADYRIKRLTKNNLIRNFITIVNDTTLGYESYVMLLELQNYTPEDEERIITFLKNHPFTKWVLKCGGDWDIQVTVIAKDKRQLARIVDEIDNFCGSSLRRYDLVIVVNLIKAENLAFILPHPKQATPSVQKILKEEEETVARIDLDAKDRLLLKVVSEDARLPIVKIAQQIHLSADATNLRMKKLARQGVIKKFQTVIDLSKLNCLLYSVFLKINNYSQKRESQIRTFFSTMPNITYAERIIGNWDARIQISCSTVQEFERIQKQIREFLKADLKYIDSALMMKEYKRVSYPKGLEETRD